MRKYDAGAYPEYLKDESGFSGHGEMLYFPSCESEVCQLLVQGGTYTIQGARTGISGACVPMGGDIINMSELTGFTGMRRDESYYYLEMYAGTTCEQLCRALELRSFDIQGWSEASRDVCLRFQKDAAFWFPAAPTEKNATVGGMFAMDAAGPSALRYGSVRKYVTGLTVASTHGSLHKISSVDRILALAGTEGACPVITRVELKLLPRQPVHWTILAFTEGRTSAMDIAQAILSSDCKVTVTALDFLDEPALGQYGDYAKAHPAYKNIPQVPQGRCGLYIQLEAGAESVMEAFLEQFLELLADHNVDGDDIWAADNYAETERFVCLRHGVAEALVHPSIPDTILLDIYTGSFSPESFMKMAEGHVSRQDIFGAMIHMGQNIVHICVRRQAKGLVELIDIMRKNGGAIGVENGIGKLKREYFK